MSLSWRKRQALASDQKSWRGLGLDSALWKSIDRNATNVKASLGNNGSTGVVTGLKFVKTEGLDFVNGASGVGEKKIFVSDPSNSAVASKTGENQFDTFHPPSGSGSGLVFTMKKYNQDSTFEPNMTNTDISGIKYYINSGGSGYKVGDDIILQGEKRKACKMIVSSISPVVSGLSSTIEGGGAGTDFPVITQDAYQTTDISVNIPVGAAASISAGNTVTLHNGPLKAGGTVTGISMNTFNFSITDTNGSAVGTSFTGFNFTTPTSGTLTGGSFSGNDFGTVNETLIVVLDSAGTAITKNITLSTDLSLDSAAATAIDTGLGGDGSCAVVGSVLVITSATTGVNSSVSISTTTDSNALALFGTTTATAGAANSNQILKIKVDGGVTQDMDLSTNCLTIGNALAAINSGLTGATATNSSGNILITSTGATGPGSKIEFPSGSGTNAAALIASPTITDGTNSTAETLKITIDGGAEQTISITANVTDIASAIGAGGVTGITGATVSNFNGNIRITSNLQSSASSVSINRFTTGPNVQRLFGLTYTWPYWITVAGNDDAPIIATGFLSAAPSPNVGDTKLILHSATGTSGDFTSGPTNQSIKINNDATLVTNNGDAVGDKVTDGGITATTTNQKTAFTEEIANGDNAFNLYQWDISSAALGSSIFAPVYSPIKFGDIEILSATQAAGASYGSYGAYGNISATTAYDSPAPVIGNTGVMQFNGRFTARVTSIVNTSPEPGFN